MCWSARLPWTCGKPAQPVLLKSKCVIFLSSIFCLLFFGSLNWFNFLPQLCSFTCSVLSNSLSLSTVIFFFNYSQLAEIMREGNGTPLQHSCLENPMDGGAWWAAVHGVAKSRTGLSDFSFTFHFHALEKEMETYSSVLATGESQGRGSLVGCRLWDRTELDTTEAT